MSSRDDDLAFDDVRERLVMELRQQYRLADNRFGNRIIDKVIKQSNGSLRKARTILPQYMERMKGVYPKVYEELIILKFMDDESSDDNVGHNETNPTMRSVPQVIAYMEKRRYRPRLN